MRIIEIPVDRSSISHSIPGNKYSINIHQINVFKLLNELFCFGVKVQRSLILTKVLFESLWDTNLNFIHLSKGKRVWKDKPS